MRTFSGIWPALVTPFTADDQVNVPVLKNLVDYLLGKHVDGFYVGGTTGEGVLMSVEERQLVVETVLAQVNHRVPVIVHVGAMAVRDAVTLAKHAQATGADGISSILPPLYDGTRSLRAYYAAIGAAAPDLPLLGYLLNPTIDAAALMRELSSIPNFAGSKYTGPNMYELRQIIDLGGGRWTVFSGMDEQCIYGRMMGVNGAIGSTLNFMPGVYRQIYKCLEAGDYAAAQDWQVRANKVTEVLITVGYPGTLKEALRMIGFDCGSPRLPKFPLSEDQCRKLQEGLKATDFAQLTAL
ncbi:MAG: dihydrodipicolinate synthase family protein [Anaerolineae bacterium]|nr:dihydrodipicolinate synthase family protein [Anaerolineae bacterium]